MRHNTMATRTKMSKGEWTFAIFIGGTLGIILFFITLAIWIPEFIMWLAK